MPGRVAAGDGLERLRAALGARTAPVSMFVRDDDAGWDDARLVALLDCCADLGVPLDLAVIPQACTQALAELLCRRLDAAPDRLGVHQHGFAHANHETVGRRCEFGPARSLTAQRDDLQRGRGRLQQLFGDRLDALFTPPWNRCDAGTPGLLAELGYAALSRDRGARPHQHLLPELSVDVDWCRLRREGADAPAPLADALAAALADAVRPVGLMLHHAQMDDTDLALLKPMLRLLGDHAALRLRPMRALWS